MDLTASDRRLVARGRRGLVQSSVVGLLRRIWRAKHLYPFVLPAVALVAYWGYVPTVGAIALAFTDWRLPDDTHKYGYRVFVGLAQFQRALEDERFWASFGNLAKIFGVSLFGGLVVSLLVAVLLHHLLSTRARRSYQVALAAPMAIPSAVGILVWQFIYQPSYGPLNRLLVALGLTQFENFEWLGDPSTVLWAILFMGLPFIGIVNVLVYLGGLQSISQDVYDAAAIDGVSPVQRMTLIEIPLIAGQIRLMFILAVLGTFTSYANILIFMSGGAVALSGGTGRTSWPAILVPALHLYNNAFLYQKYEYATALGVILMIIMVGLSWLIRRMIEAEG